MSRHELGNLIAHSGYDTRCGLIVVFCSVRILDSTNISRGADVIANQCVYLITGTNCMYDISYTVRTRIYYGVFRIIMVVTEWYSFVNLTFL